MGLARQNFRLLVAACLLFCVLVPLAHGQPTVPQGNLVDESDPDVASPADEPKWYHRPAKALKNVVAGSKQPLQLQRTIEKPAFEYYAAVTGRGIAEHVPELKDLTDASVSVMLPVSPEQYKRELLHNPGQKEPVDVADSLFAPGRSGSKAAQPSKIELVSDTLERTTMSDAAGEQRLRLFDGQVLEQKALVFAAPSTFHVLRGTTTTRLSASEKAQLGFSPRAKLAEDTLLAELTSGVYRVPHVFPLTLLRYVPFPLAHRYSAHATIQDYSRIKKDGSPQIIQLEIQRWSRIRAVHRYTVTHGDVSFFLMPSDWTGSALLGRARPRRWTLYERDGLWGHHADPVLELLQYEGQIWRVSGGFDAIRRRSEVPSMLGALLLGVVERWH